MTRQLNHIKRLFLEIVEDYQDSMIQHVQYACRSITAKRPWDAYQSANIVSMLSVLTSGCAWMVVVQFAETPLPLFVLVLVLFKFNYIYDSCRKAQKYHNVSFFSLSLSLSYDYIFQWSNPVVFIKVFSVLLYSVAKNIWVLFSYAAHQPDFIKV